MIINLLAMLYFSLNSLNSYNFSNFSKNEEYGNFPECIEITDEVVAKIPKNFANYILEDKKCLPSEVYSDISSYIFFLNEKDEKIKNFSDINNKTRAIIVKNPYSGSEFLESDFCDAEKCQFSIKNKKIFEEKFCNTDNTVFGNATQNWNEKIIEEKYLTINFAGKKGKIPDFYGVSGMRGCEGE